MKDDVFKKLKNLLSGSVKISSDVEKIDNYENKMLMQEEDLINNFMDQILDSTWVDEELKSATKPSYYLSKKEKSYWLFNTSIKTLMNIKSGTEIIIIERGEKYSLCMIGYSTFSIPNKIIIYAGWN